MTELPEEVRRELEELLGETIPSYAVSLYAIVDADKKGRSRRWWDTYLKNEIAEGKWIREKRGHSFLYWPVGDD